MHFLMHCALCLHYSVFVNYRFEYAFGVLLEISDQLFPSCFDPLVSNVCCSEVRDFVDLGRQRCLELLKGW